MQVIIISHVSVSETIRAKLIECELCSNLTLKFFHFLLFSLIFDRIIFVEFEVIRLVSRIIGTQIADKDSLEGLPRLGLWIVLALQ